MSFHQQWSRRSFLMVSHNFNTSKGRGNILDRFGSRSSSLNSPNTTKPRLSCFSKILSAATDPQKLRNAPNLLKAFFMCSSNVSTLSSRAIQKATDKYWKPNLQTTQSNLNVLQQEVMLFNQMIQLLQSNDSCSSTT